jgi:hypothetical protein
MPTRVTSKRAITKSGRVLSEAELDRLVELAEKGFDLSTWKPRRGRPSLSATPGTHSPRIEARVPEALHRRVSERAASEGRTVSEVVRLLLEGYAADR